MTQTPTDLGDHTFDAALCGWPDAVVDAASGSVASGSVASGPVASGAEDSGSGVGFGLVGDATAPAVARGRARCVLAAWGVGQDTADDVVVVVSELVTNAIEHALPPIVLRMEPRAASGTAPVGTVPVATVPVGTAPVGTARVGTVPVGTARVGAVRVEVSDGGPRTVPGTWTRSREPEEHGRGSHIIACLALAHGTRRNHGRTIRWADLCAG